MFKGNDFKNEIFYDDFKMFSSMNLTADDDIAFINILKLNLDNQYNNKKFSSRNSLNITPSEYREFLQTFKFLENYIKTYLNNVMFKEGIKFPYNPNEIYTSVSF